MSKPIKDYSIDELQKIVEEAKLPPFRAQQILTWIYGRNVQSYEEMTDIPKVIREQFDRAFPLYVPEIVECLMSNDGSRKYVVRYHDGAIAETVGMPTGDGRLSVCCSSQSGCGMGCVFCATGKAGLTRSLTPGEIVDQVLLVGKDFDERVTHVVVMGQGEPFANYGAVMAALRIMNHPKLLNIGARHITLSTCGIIEGVERFAQEPEQFTLAVSLHAARQPVRDELLPALKNNRLGALRQALEAYTQQTGRRFSFEYALMEGVNDSEEDLEELIDYCQRMLCHVNLIPLNKVPDSLYRPVTESVMRRWERRLEEEGIATTVRKSRGSDIAGACGQLAHQVAAGQ